MASSPRSSSALPRSTPAALTSYAPPLPGRSLPCRPPWARRSIRSGCSSRSYRLTASWWPSCTYRRAPSASSATVRRSGFSTMPSPIRSSAPMAPRHTLAGRRRLPVIRQTEAAECGLACLAMIAGYHGHRIDLNTLRRRHPVSLKGVTLRGLMQVASQLDLAGRPLRFELEHLAQLQLPAIAHWDMNHFVVLRAVSKRGVVIHDPGSGERSMSLCEASK